jgi:hypothetical protein
MRPHKFNKLFFVMSFMGAVALALPSLAQREGRERGEGNRGESGDRGGRSASSSRMNAPPSSAPRASTQANPRSSAVQSRPRAFNTPEGGRSQSIQRDTPRARPSDRANMPQTFRRGDGVTVPNRTSEPRVARGDVDRDDRDRSSRQQQSFFRGPTDRPDSANRVDRDRDRADAIRDRDRQTDGDWRNQVFGDRDRDRFDGNRDRFDRDRDRDRDRFARDFTRLRSDWNWRNRNDVPFRLGWWDNYRRDRWPAFGPWASVRWRDRPFYWWNWTTAARLTPWFVFGWNRPYYWQYGPGANIYYQGDYVYYDGQQYEPIDAYYDRIYALAHSVPNVDAAAAESMEWQPLGVFVATDDERSGERSLQIAVTREGIIGGTYYNSGNGHVHPISGMVDKHSQRAAWAFADGEHPKVVFETSIFNLTKDQVTMMVHFGPRADETEVWNLVRMEEPDGEGVLPGNPPPSTPSRNQLP